MDVSNGGRRWPDWNDGGVVLLVFWLLGASMGPDDTCCLLDLHISNRRLWKLVPNLNLNGACWPDQGKVRVSYLGRHWQCVQGPKFLLPRRGICVGRIKAEGSWKGQAWFLWEALQMEIVWCWYLRVILEERLACYVDRWSLLWCQCSYIIIWWLFTYETIILSATNDGDILLYPRYEDSKSPDDAKISRLRQGP